MRKSLPRAVLELSLAGVLPTLPQYRLLGRSEASILPLTPQPGKRDIGRPSTSHRPARACPSIASCPMPLLRPAM